MRPRLVFEWYLRSLGWVAAFSAVGTASLLVANVAVADFVLHNPNRTFAESLGTMLVMPPLMGLIAAVCASLVFAVPQMLQVTIALAMSRHPSSRSAAILLALTPIMAVVTWYCWEYALPKDFGLGINEGADWVPYRYGLTPARYATTLAFQLPETVFSASYLHATALERKPRRVALVGLALATACGAGLGLAGTLLPSL